MSTARERYRSQTREKYKEAIEEAKATCLDYPVLHRELVHRAECLHKFLTGEINGSDYNEVEQEPLPGMVWVENMSELYGILVIGNVHDAPRIYTEAQCREQSFKIAQRYGLDTKLGAVFVRKDRSPAPFGGVVWNKIPENISDVHARNALFESLQASRKLTIYDKIASGVDDRYTRLARYVPGSATKERYSAELNGKAAGILQDELPRDRRFASRAVVVGALSMLYGGGNLAISGLRYASAGETTDGNTLGLALAATIAGGLLMRGSGRFIRAYDYFLKPLLTTMRKVEFVKSGDKKEEITETETLS